MSLIYIVEDDSNIREIELFALQNSGYKTDGFECASDFWKGIRKKIRVCRMCRRRVCILFMPLMNLGVPVL